jgi:signal peptidase I
MKNSLGDAAPFPETGSGDRAPYRFIYRGPSMAPTFRPGQVLYVRTQAHNMTRGDVIVFQNHSANGHIVHRVISILPGGFATRGDGNLHTDPDPIHPNQVIGRVEKVSLRGLIRPVVGGWRGLWLARILHTILLVKRLLRRGLSRPYRWLKRSGILIKLWHPELETIYFETQDGPLVKYVHKGKTVASCWTKTNRWWFKRPYDFVVDPKRNEAKGKR